MIELFANVDVEDLDRAIEFYTRAFGLKVGIPHSGSVMLKSTGSPRATVALNGELGRLGNLGSRRSPDGSSP